MHVFKYGSDNILVIMNRYFSAGIYFMKALNKTE